MPAERTIVRVADRAAAREWFVQHQDDTASVFFMIGKKGGSVPTPSYDDLVEIALIHGWIDAQKQGLDADCYLLAFSPRRARSPWSQVNRQKAEALITSGRMAPAGLAAVEVARTNGRWDAAYARQSEFELQPDFLEALTANPTAAAFFATLSRTQHFAVYYRLNDVVRPETRARRIETFVDLFERREKLR